MKRNFLLCLLACALLLLPAPASAQILPWSYEPILTDLQQSGAQPDLHQDAAGNFHLTYWHQREQHLVYGFQPAAGGPWQWEVMPDGGAYGYRSAVCTDAAGRVHIAYLHNDGGNAWLRYAVRDGGTWTIEQAFPDSHIGVYGADLAFPSYVQPSLRIRILDNGEPAILFFNGRVDNVVFCAPIDASYINYKLDLNLTIRLPDGGWAWQTFPNIRYDGPINCLLTGDRFGEFCRWLTLPDGRNLALTNSLHNHDLLAFVSDPGSLSGWQPWRVDSTSRIFTTVNNLHFREGHHFPDAVLGDSLLHLAYGVANHYGFGPNYLNRQTFHYARVHPDSIGRPGYQPRYVTLPPNSTIRTYFSIQARGDDTVMIAYYSPPAGRVVLAQSTDGGLAWTQDSLMAVFTNDRLQTALRGDSLHVLVYDQVAEGLRMASRAVQGGPWVLRELTTTRVSGPHLAAAAVRTAGGDQLYAAYTESVQDRLFLAERSSSGSWATEPVDSAGGGYQDLDLARGADGSLWLSYTARAGAGLRLARRSTGGWVQEPIPAAVSARNSQIALAGDSAHLVYYDLSTGSLRHLRGTAGAWAPAAVVDSSSDFAGVRPDLVAGPDQRLHAAYLDVDSAKLRYAVRQPGGAWAAEDVTESFDYVPAFCAVRITSGGQPVIAFRDANGNRIRLAERNAAGVWTISAVNVAQTNLIGAPLRLILDASDRPWILYNFTSVLDEIRLVRRDDDGVWQPVSVAPNPGQIANSFEFLLLEDDLYIIGKQNDAGNNGLGMLFAEQGIRTLADPALAPASMNLYPNPGRGDAVLQLSVSQAQPVTVRVYNLSGGEALYMAHHPVLAAGTHELALPRGNLAPGVYLCAAETPAGAVFRKWVILP
ncbi:MAG: T9SS type A sorting domain-containing protein [Bacteroidia bacterium]|nr:T9SS type A sorting domain-containing protein [Bacteroidia bacterium]